MRARAKLGEADPASEHINDVIIVGTFSGSGKREQAEFELDELEELARTLDAKLLGRYLLPLRDPHPATYFRGGAVETIGETIAGFGKPVVLVNDKLTPGQQRNLEERWETTVLDRTEVILAIFAKRATSAEGRLQVEMAQLEHMLPRLAGGWQHLERQRGRVGVGGMRGGMGEKQIEIDRRLINHRLAALRRKLVTLQRQRSTRRSARSAVPLGSFALVGYTNAGKSTLLNALTHSDVYADNLLFATLDPTSRRLEFASGRRVIVTDTVGFIQSLPTELVEAFSSTLEEVKEAHALIVVVDASHPEATDQLHTVLETLKTMECDQPTLLVANKIDLVPPDEVRFVINRLEKSAQRKAIALSGMTKAGIGELKTAIDDLAAQLVPDTASNRSHTGY